MARKYFGTDGIRGRVGDYPVTADFMLKLGWAAGRVLGSNGGGDRVIIGKDTRISGYMFESALEAGLSAAGVGRVPRRRLGAAPWRRGGRFVRAARPGARARRWRWNGLTHERIDG